MALDTTVRDAPSQSTPIRPLATSHRARHPRAVNTEILGLFVLLALLAGVVWLGVRHVTHQSSTAACQTNVLMLTTSVTALEVENFNTPSTPNEWRDALLHRTDYRGAPFVTSWPSSPDYAMAIAGSVEGRDSGDGHVPSNGDVLVTVTATQLRYDATARLGGGCSAL